MTTEELSRTDEIGKNFVETAPPAGEVRNIAEWEQMEGVLITYEGSFGIPYSSIAEMSQDCIVTTIVSGSSQETTVRNLFTNNGVNLTNCNFLYAPIDRWWSRDYGPWYIAIDNSEIAIIDFPYNRPRPNDDEIPKKMATFLDEDWYGMDVVNTGGNYMCDGYGVAAQTDLVLDENLAGINCYQDVPLTEEQVYQRIEDYLGITQYFVRPDPTNEDIKHIDCWGKFLDIDKVVITQVPLSDNRYADYEAAAAFFAETNCSYGYPYQVFRVQAATYNDYDTNPYTNSLILNNKVFVPQSGSSFDDEAIAVYEEAMPGYEIYGSYSSYGWLNTDAFHCRTYGIADREMLFIKHYPLFAIVNSDFGYPVTAEVYSYAGNEIETGYPVVFYSIDGGITFQEVIMENIITKSGIYQAVIPQQTEGTEIAYYIKAVDSEGKTANHPVIGEPDPHVFTAGTESPVVEIKENIKLDYFNIYPNPCEGLFFVWVEVENETTMELSIFNISGSQIYTENINVNKGDNLKKIEIMDLSSGIYTVKLQSENSTLIKKLIVQ
jgi:agmatine/peptidylarginine deiminase